MTIQLVQTAQISGVTSLGTIENYSCGYSYGFSVVINPTLPIVLFSYENNGYMGIAVVIGNVAQYYGGGTASQSAGIVAYHTPIVFFENSIVIPVLYGSYGDWWDYASSLVVVNYQAKISNYQGYVLPYQFSASEYLLAGFTDAYLDFQNQNLYLLGVNYNMFIVLLFAIPFSQLSTLLNQLQLPSQFQEASLMPPNGENLISYYYTYPPPCAEGGTDIAPTMIYYNEQFYLFFGGGEEAIYMWTFSLSEITWSNTLPSSTTTTINGTTYYYVPSNLQTVGNIVNIMPEAGYPDIYIYGFNVGFNYYISGGTIYPEILVPVILDNYNVPEGWTLAVISVNPNTLNVTAVADIPYNGVNPALSVYPYLPIYISGGLLVSTAYVSSSSSSSYWYVFVYDRNTGDMALFPPPNDVIFVIPAEGGYVISVTGSSTNATITIYQVVADAVPVITNVEFANNTISGTATDLVSNTPVSGATVALFQLISQGGYEFSGAIVATTTTDSNGDFSFQVSQPGYYAIRAFT